MLRWTVADLAERAKVAPNTVVRFEGENSVNTATVSAIQRALEAAGAEFLAGNGVRISAQVATKPTSAPGSARKPASPRKPAPPRKAPERKAAPSSKLDQIRALREQGAG
jgi:transcriptional regulator with XRE-family HTH domain